MPPGTKPPQPVGTVKLTWHGLCVASPFALVQWLNLTGYSTMLIGDLNSLVDDVIAAASTTGWIHSLSNATSLTSLHAILHQDTDLYLETNRTCALQGSRTGSASDVATCQIVSWVIGARYRGGKPRTYLPGVATSDMINNNQLASGQISDLQTRSNNYLSAVNAIVNSPPTTTRLGTVSFASGKLWRNPPIFRPFTGVAVHPRLGTQRRRLGQWVA